MNCILVMKIKWSLDINTGAVERSEAARARHLASATVVGPVTARADQLWHAETGPPCARTTIPNPDHYNQRAFLGMLVRVTNIPGDFGPPDQNPCRTKITVTVPCTMPYFHKDTLTPPYSSRSPPPLAGGGPSTIVANFPKVNSGTVTRSKFDHAPN